MKINESLVEIEVERLRNRYYFFRFTCFQYLVLVCWCSVTGLGKAGNQLVRKWYVRGGGLNLPCFHALWYGVLNQFITYIKVLLLSWNIACGGGGGVLRLSAYAPSCTYVLHVCIGSTRSLEYARMLSFLLWYSSVPYMQDRLCCNKS